MSSATSRPRSNRSATRPLQFDLRTLLVVMSALSLLFAVMAAIGALWSSMLLLFLCLIAAHVLGNAVGTHLRDHARDDPRDSEACHGYSRETCDWTHARSGDASTLALPGEHRLSAKTQLSRAMIALTALGAVAGAVGGGTLLALANWQQIGISGIMLAVVSTGVLGGFLGFLASTFWLTIRSAWREAIGKTGPASPLSSSEALGDHADRDVHALIDSAR